MSPGREAVTITRLTGMLRSEILSGAYQPGDRLPSRAELAAQTGLSQESAMLALRALRDEGLVTLEQGRGTYVRALHAWLVTVRVPGAGKAASAADVRRAERERPAVTGLSERGDGQQREWAMTVRAPDAGVAAATGLAAARSAARGAWNEASARIAVVPAQSDVTPLT